MIIKESSKLKDDFLFLVLFVVLWVLVGLNTGNADYQAYNNMYNAAAENNFYYAEKGFLYVCKFFNLFGFDYQGFLAVYSFIALLLLSIFVRENTDCSWLVLMLYFIFPFLYDAVQIRNLMVEAIVLFSTRYLKRKNTRDLVKFVICIIVATTQHVMALAYLSFVLIFIKEKKHLYVIVIALSLLCLMCSRMVFDKVLPVLYSIGGRKNYHFRTSYPAFGTVCKYLMFEISIIVGSLFVCRNVRIKNAEVRFDERLIVVAFLFIPLIILDGDYFRVFRNCLPLYYCVLTNTGNYNLKKNRIIVQVFLILYVCIGWTVSFAPGIYFYDTVTYPIFHNNILRQIF